VAGAGGQDEYVAGVDDEFLAVFSAEHQAG
jgi:hypothetical protein